MAHQTSGSLPDIIRMASLTPAERVGIANDFGSLEVGKQMDAVIVDGPAIDLIRVGADTIRAVIKKGRVVHAR